MFRERLAKRSKYFAIYSFEMETLMQYNYKSSYYYRLHFYIDNNNYFKDFLLRLYRFEFFTNLDMICLIFAFRERRVIYKLQDEIIRIVEN